MLHAALAGCLHDWHEQTWASVQLDCAGRDIRVCAGRAGLLTAGQFVRIGAPAVGLAIGTVLIGMARTASTVRERLRESELQAVTDPLTGPGNRRHLLHRGDRRHRSQIGSVGPARADSRILLWMQQSQGVDDVPWRVRPETDPHRPSLRSPACGMSAIRAAAPLAKQPPRHARDSGRS